jgi:protein disulfide-isomerase
MSCRTQLRGVVAFAAAVCLPALALAQPTGIAWRSNLDAAKIEAAQSNRLLLLHFYTQTCGPCKLLDQNVLSQPQVGAAVEREYVPVKIDADASPALAHMFRIDRVPTEIVLTPQGNPIATLSTPDNPDGYVAQLQNLAKHFRQTTPGAGPDSPPANLNSAYAGLPVNAKAAAAPAPATNAVATPQVQANPYVPYGGAPPAGTQAQTAAATPSRYGAGATTAGVAGATTAGAGALASTAPPANALAGGPAMPTNAMPQSYRTALSSQMQTPNTSTAPAVAGPVAGTASTQEQSMRGDAIAAATAAVGTGEAAGASTAASVPAGATVRPAQPPLPANSPPVAFDGCCPVTLKTQNKWAPGSTAFGAIHRGRTYLFVGEQERQQFLADPDAYSPVFAGYDPVLLLEKQQSVPGSRKFGFRYGGAFYLFATKDSMDKFQASPQTYAASVRQAMAHVDGTAGATIRR